MLTTLSNRGFGDCLLRRRARLCFLRVDLAQLRNSRLYRVRVCVLTVCKHLHSPERVSVPRFGRNALPARLPEVVGKVGGILRIDLCRLIERHDMAVRLCNLLECTGHCPTRGSCARCTLALQNCQFLIVCHMSFVICALYRYTRKRSSTLDCACSFANSHAVGFCPVCSGTLRRSLATRG